MKVFQSSGYQSRMVYYDHKLSDPVSPYLDSIQVESHSLPITQLHFVYCVAETELEFMRMKVEREVHTQVREMKASGNMPAFVDAMKDMQSQVADANRNATFSRERLHFCTESGKAKDKKIAVMRRLIELMREKKPRLP